MFSSADTLPKTLQIHTEVTNEADCNFNVDASNISLNLFSMGQKLVLYILMLEMLLFSLFFSVCAQNDFQLSSFN